MWYENTKDFLKNTLILSVARKQNISMGEVPAVVRKALRAERKDGKVADRSTIACIVRSVKGKPRRGRRSKRLKKKRKKVRGADKKAKAGEPKQSGKKEVKKKGKSKKGAPKKAVKKELKGSAAVESERKVVKYK